MTQPVPSVTDADIERIVRRDFPAGRVGEVLALLTEYGKESWHNEPQRVRAAVLKLGGGKIERLREALRSAKADYRDVLAPAEYPNYCAQVPGPGVPPEPEARRIVESDWKQYEEWFNR